MKLLSFMRKELGIRGKTVHSGRGFWMFYSNEAMTEADFHALVDAKVKGWSDHGLLAKVDVMKTANGERYSYRFNSNQFEGNTRFGYFVPNSDDNPKTFLASVA